MSIMSEEENKRACLKYFENYKGGMRLGSLESLTTLQNEASLRGLDPEDMEIILKTLKVNKLSAGLFISLVKCLIPKKKVSDEFLKDIIRLYFTKYDKLSVTCSIILLQWLEGVWEYQLINRKEMEIYYECFFFKMLNQVKLVSHLSRIVYLLTKPNKVSRIEVIRILRLQEKFAKPQKCIHALLSLFKSYKPDVVPEKIISVNIESVWKPFPEVLRLGFESARNRNIAESHDEDVFNWNTGQSHRAKRSEPLIPSIRYFQMGSIKFSNQNDKYLFDIHTSNDIAKKYFDTKLPTNSVSLLANSAGYHFLIYADPEYQSRFCHNLYNILRRAFILEPSQFSKGQKNQLLDMTIDFCQYMQQGIPVVNLFLKELLPHDTGEFRIKLLKLVEWYICISLTDLQSFAGYFDTIFLESNVEEKCQVIETLTELTSNMCINQQFGKEKVKPSPFLSQTPLDDFKSLLPIVLKIASHLIIKGLSIHNVDSSFLITALMFYQKLNKLIDRCSEPLLFIPSRIVIYGGLITKSCTILSRVSSLLTQYRAIVLRLCEILQENRFEPAIKLLALYAHDLADALWNNQLFLERRNRSLPENVLVTLPEEKDQLLNLNNHIAILPYKFTLQKSGLLSIDSKEAALHLSDNYFPHVSRFLRSFDDFSSHAIVSEISVTHRTDVYLLQNLYLFDEVISFITLYS